MKKITLLASLFACTFLGNAQQVTTIAGSGQGSLDGKGTAAQFSYPMGLATDANGNLYLADSMNNTIRKITPAGDVTTFAGSASGYAEGTGTAAKFDTTYGVAIDADGNVFVADQYNNRIRKITPSGVVSTFAGSVNGNADGTGAAAKFNLPTGVAVDAAGNVFDYANYKIKKITPSGVVTTLAGSTPGKADGTGTKAQFNFPVGLTIDAAGNIYVADTGNDLIRKITPDGVVTTFAGSVKGYSDGTGISAKFNAPKGVAIDVVGNLYVADSNNHRIRKIDPAGVVTTIAGSVQGYADGVGTASKFDTPSGVTIDAAGNIYVADSANKKIRKISIQSLGINDQSLERITFAAYPNPCRDLLKIQSIDQNTYSFILNDIAGQPVLSGSCNGINKSEINTSGLSSGIYILSITSDGKTQHIKVVRE